MKDFIINEVKQYVLESRENWLESSEERYYDEPAVNFASADDPIFLEYKKIISDSHMTPKEVFEGVYGEGSYTGGTVISVMLPVSEKIRASNRAQKVWPSRQWALLRAYADELFKITIMKHIEELLKSNGYRAVAPLLTDSYKVYRADKGPESNWSERHVAYAAGLGTFSLNDGFISEKGIAVRFLSVVTDLLLEPDVRTAESHVGNCLFYSSGKCGACIGRCPVGAITDKGHDKMKCYQYVYGEESRKLAETYGGDRKTGSGCGLCQTKVPCEYRNPRASVSLENI